MLKDSISRFWLCKRVEFEMGDKCVLAFCSWFLPDSQFDLGEDDVGMWKRTTSPLARPKG